MEGGGGGRVEILVQGIDRWEYGEVERNVVFLRNWKRIVAILLQRFRGKRYKILLGGYIVNIYEGFMGYVEDLNFIFRVMRKRF